jgi:hypothetical protein
MTVPARIATTCATSGPASSSRIEASSVFTNQNL